MSVPGVVDQPVQENEAIRALVEAAQNEIIAAQPNTLAGGQCMQYGPEFYQFEAGIGTIHFGAQMCREVATVHAQIIAAAYGGVFPMPSGLKPDPNAYYFIGALDQPTVRPDPINHATVRYFERFYSILKANGFRHVNSVAYEILDFFCPPEWKQLNWLGLPAQSGWYPPSSFVQPTNFDALGYLAKVQVQLLDLQTGAGIVPMFQIGEPWWWDGSYNNGEGKNAPCIYDQKTMDLYTQETGGVVPLPMIKSIFDPVDPAQWPYVDWLRVKLGVSTNWIRDKVKQSYPQAQATLLFFTPQIMSPASELTGRLNFPTEQWVYPNYDFVQIEDYDWVIDGRLDLVPLTFKAATETLGYPLDVVHYFIGFNLLPETAKQIWANCDVALGLALEAKIPHLYPWSYTQVVRDGVIVKKRVACGC